MNPFIMNQGKKNAETFASDIHADEDDGLQAFKWFFGITFVLTVVLALCGIVL